MNTLLLLGLLLQFQARPINPLDLWLDQVQMDRANAPLAEARKRQMAEMRARACETATKAADDAGQVLHRLIGAERQGTVPVGLRDALKKERRATKAMWNACGY